MLVGRQYICVSHISAKVQLLLYLKMRDSTLYDILTQSRQTTPRNLQVQSTDFDQFQLKTCPAGIAETYLSSGLRRHTLKTKSLIQVAPTMSIGTLMFTTLVVALQCCLAIFS